MDVVASICGSTNVWPVRSCPVSRLSILTYAALSVCSPVFCCSQERMFTLIWSMSDSHFIPPSTRVLTSLRLRFRSSSSIALSLSCLSMSMIPKYTLWTLDRIVYMFTSSCLRLTSAPVLACRVLADAAPPSHICWVMSAVIPYWS